LIYQYPFYLFLFQFYQKIDKSIIVSIVVTNEFNENTSLKLKNDITQRIGNIPIEILVVDEIPRDPNTGKIRCVITEIK
jgi:acyl-coenzyme A synthetase/AMP-(fatty) acid ligase